MKKTLFFIFLCTQVNFAHSEDKKDPVVAVVNGKKILKSQLYDYHRDNLNFVRGQREVTLESSLNDMINRIVGIDLAKKNKLDKQPIVQEKMNDILYHAQISKDLENTLLKIEVSDDEVKRYYKENPEYRTAQILLRVRAVPDEEEVKSSFEKAVKIHTEVSQKPDDFLEFANRFSQSSSAINGGDMGYQPSTRLTPEYYSNIKGKKVGTITKPFRSQYGFHIVKILGVKSQDQINTEMYKKLIYDIKRDKILEEYFSKLRNTAKISIDKRHLQ